MNTSDVGWVALLRLLPSGIEVFKLGESFLSLDDKGQMCRSVQSLAMILSQLRGVEGPTMSSLLIPELIQSTHLVAEALLPLKEQSDSAGSVSSSRWDRFLPSLSLYANHGHVAVQSPVNMRRAVGILCKLLLNIKSACRFYAEKTRESNPPKTPLPVEVIQIDE